MRVSRVALLCMVASLFMLAGSAKADTITAKFDGVLPETNVSLVSPGHTGAVQAGVYNWTRKLTTSTDPNNNWAYDPLQGTSFDAFCIQANQNTPTSGYQVFTVTDLKDAPIGGTGTQPMGSLRALLLSELWANNESTAVSGGNLTSAAFQMAVWEIVFEDLSGLPDPSDAGFVTALQNKLEVNSTATGKGSVYTTTTNVANQANIYLDGLDLLGSKSTLRALSSGTYQDQMFLTNAPIPPSGAPVPAAVWGGLALFGLVGAKRARAK